MVRISAERRADKALGSFGRGFCFGASQGGGYEREER